jgi:hypothetical protein
MTRDDGESRNVQDDDGFQKAGSRQKGVADGK